MNKLLLGFSCFLAWPVAAGPAADVVLIGLDGVSLNLLEPYADQGATPHLKALMREGARGDLASIWPLRTPQVWTTVSTGKLPGKHGIWDHVSDTYFNPPGIRTKKKKRVTSRDRRSRSLWQILDGHGISTLTVGWMATWPADALNHGVMVAPIELMHDKRQTTIKGSFYRGEDGMVWPASHNKTVQGLIVEPSQVSPQELETFADIPLPRSALYGLPRLKRYVYALRWSLARAKSVSRLTETLFQKAPTRVVSAYWQCTDSLLHRFWVFQESEQAIVTRLKGHGIPHDHASEMKRRFGRVVEACYRDIDARVGRLLKQVRGPDTLVLVVSDHGFGPASVPHRLKGEPYSGDHLEDGVILASGPGIDAGSRIGGATVADIAPSILHRLGLPVADDMDGKILEALRIADAPSIASVPTYESKPQIKNPFPAGFPLKK